MITIDPISGAVLGCPDCAILRARIEELESKLEGVTKAARNFFARIMALEAELEEYSLSAPIQALRDIERAAKKAK